MPKAAYFDCFSGASGDMILAALIDAGADLELLRSGLGCLALSGYELTTSQVKRASLRALRVQVVICSADQPHRCLSDILKLLDDSDLNQKVKTTVAKVFRRLAQAEAAVHGIEIEKVHFHEVGAVDSIVDIVGACLALDLLGIEKIYCSQLATGSGTVRCAHGELPIPAPATAQLLLGVPTTVGYPGKELTTPTGAAILTTLAEGFGAAPNFSTEKIGCGAGHADLPQYPNILRVRIGQVQVDTPPDIETDQVWLIQTNLDDTPGEFIGPLYDLLFADGALEVYVIPIQMKKNRPGVLLSVLVAADKLSRIEDTLFEHTPTFGLRKHLCRRSKLFRRMTEIHTRYGKIRLKVGRRGSRDLTVSPEFEDCRAAASRHGISAREVHNEALACYRQTTPRPSDSNKQAEDK